MKKFLLTLATVAMAFTAGAAEQVVFDIDAAQTDDWKGDANGYTLTKDGFTLSTDKADSSTDLISPNNNAYAWRVYKGSKFTITAESFTMKTVTITYDTYSDNKYCVSLTLFDGWKGALENDTFTASLEAGSKTFTAQAVEAQVRIKKIVVSDEYTAISGGGSGEDPEPENPGSGPELENPVVVFDINAAQTDDWKGDANGYTLTKDGFTLSTDKADSSTDLISPNNNAYAWRVYKGSKFTITAENMVMKGVKITYDTYNDNQYCVNLTLFDGWTGVLSNDTFTASLEAGSKTFTAQAVDAQARIKKIEVSSELPKAGVAGIVADNAPAVYYNLQGVRVENPTKGLYIVVKGNKSTKVVF